MTQKEAYDFIVTLKHPDYKIYNFITVLMCIMTVAASALSLMHWQFQQLSWVNIILIGIIVFNLSMNLFNNQKETISTFKWSLYAAAFLWLLYPLHIPYIGIFFIIAALLERQIKFPQEVGFSKEGITFNTFPFKNYTWQQVSNVMLRDNMLTLDFINNKIIQREIEPAELTEEENEFNEFCRQQIAGDHSS
jgi:hypothetical protein